MWKVKVWVASSCPTLCDPIDTLGSSVHGILSVRILEGVAIPFSRGSSQPRNQTQVFCIAGRVTIIWGTREDPKRSIIILNVYEHKNKTLNCVTKSNRIQKVIDTCPVQSLSRVRLFVTPWTAALQASLSITNSQRLLKVMSIELVMPSNHLICRPLLLPPSIFLSIKVFSNESALCIRWPKYWSFSFNISPSNEYSGLISFRMDWLDLLAVQGTLKSLLQHHSSKASVLQWSAFFVVQLSHPYMIIGKTIALTRQAFVDKVMSLLFNMLFQLVITFFFQGASVF